VVTVHDCLLTNPEQAERVKRIMVEAFESADVTPMIKSTALNNTSKKPVEEFLGLGWNQFIL
jgi:hypothetical protein